MPNVQIPPGLSESDDVDHDQTQGGTEGNPHGDSAASGDVSSIQSSADVDHDNTSGGTAGNPHSSSASTNHGNAAHSANFETDSGAQSRVDSHENKNNPHSSSADTNHGNAAHNTTFAADGDAQPPLNHGNGAHVANFITGAIIERVEFNTSGTYTVPNDADQLVIEAVGAGSEGGNEVGGGGGAKFLVVVPAKGAMTGTVSVEVGAGGLSSGGASKFGQLEAPGGNSNFFADQNNEGGNNAICFPGGTGKPNDAGGDSFLAGAAGGSLDGSDNGLPGGDSLVEDPNGGGSAGGGDGVNGGGGGGATQQGGAGGFPGGGGGAGFDLNAPGGDGRVIVWAL